MNITLFKKPYVVRRHGEQKLVKGHATASYSDSVKIMNVQPLGSDDLQALPEGERAVKRVKAYGAEILTAADDKSGIRGDRLFYRGLWYECKSSVPYDNTPIGQCVSDFVVLPHDKQDAPPKAVKK